MREQLYKDGIIVEGQRARERTGRIGSNRYGFLPGEEVEDRLKDFRSAIQVKAHNYRKGADMLLKPVTGSVMRHG